MKSNYLGRWFKNDSEDDSTGTEIEIINVIGDNAIASDGKKIPLVELDHSGEYEKLNAFGDSEINSLKSIANQHSKTINDNTVKNSTNKDPLGITKKPEYVETKTSESLNFTEQPKVFTPWPTDRYGKPLTIDTPLEDYDPNDLIPGANLPNSLIYPNNIGKDGKPIVTSTSTKYVFDYNNDDPIKTLIESIIKIQRSKNKKSKFPVTINLEFDFDILTVIKLAMESGASDLEIIQHIMQHLPINIDDVKKAIVLELIPDNETDSDIVLENREEMFSNILNDEIRYEDLK